MIDHEGHELVKAAYIQTAADIMRQVKAGDPVEGGAMSFLKHWL
jgi:hypothetical protein